MARVVFLGTPEFGVPVLEALIRQHEVLAVITQPDRAGGRGRSHALVPPVKQVALAHGLAIWQPQRLRRDREVVQQLRALQPDVLVLAAYGQILRREVLESAAHGCIGVHASLLPRWRRAAPIAAAILHGDAQTGITLMLTDEGMDTGAILAQRALPIASRDTTETLTARLAALGAELLIESLPAWLAGGISPQPQEEAEATLAPTIEKAQGHIAWHRSAIEIDRQIRAYTPWPGTFAHYGTAVLKVLQARPLARSTVALPGTVVQVPEGLAVATGDGLLLLETAQLAGGKATTASALARGHRDLLGSVLA